MSSLTGKTEEKLASDLRGVIYMDFNRKPDGCGRIATGDYDAIIIGHSQFERIPVSQERQERLLQEQIAEIEDGISEMKRTS